MAKMDCLMERIKAHGSARAGAHAGVHAGVLVAFSGGLDSAVVVAAAARAGMRVMAVTGVSETTPQRDIDDARRVTGALGVEHREMASREMEREEFLRNPANRCYHCKDALYQQLTAMARDEGFACVMDGLNASDLEGHRPGMAAAREHGVVSPLAECAMSKLDVREAARELGLDIADKPASPCLSSRFAYGVRISAEGLRRVARAEGYLRAALGIDELRVRDMGGRASVEVPLSAMGALVAMEGRVRSELMAMGFQSVEIDSEGFRSGKLSAGMSDGR